MSGSALLRAQDASPSPDTQFNNLAPLGEELRALGNWESQYAHIARAARNIWASNGWTDEADVFARDVVLDVARIPPWELTQRIERLTELVSERYAFSGDQRARFQQRVVREVAGVLLRHSGVILTQVHEVIQARSADQPFTPDQVARWTEQTEPLMADSRQRLGRFLDDLATTMTPQQRAILERDRQSIDKRLAYIDARRSDWRAGRWTPDAWGLQDDPIQKPSASMPATDPAGGAPRAKAGAKTDPELPTRWLAHDPATWAAYVRDFVTRCRANTAQREAAWSIHAETFSRAVAYQQTHVEEMRAVADASRATDPVFGPVRALFAELQTRLDALRTASQRSTAMP